MTPVSLFLTIYYVIPLVRNRLLTFLLEVLCTKTIDMLIMIFQTIHSTWPSPFPLHTDSDEAPTEKGGCLTVY